MDSRRLSTGDLLAMDILSVPSPTTDVPENREEYSGVSDFYNFVGVPAVVAALEAGKVVTSSNYYGIPYAWKESDSRYRCLLLQYRAITESPIFDNATEAAEWFEKTFYATDG